MLFFAKVEFNPETLHTNVLLIKSILLKGPVFRDNKSYNSRQ